MARLQDIDKKLGVEWVRHRRRIIIVSYDLLRKLPRLVLDDCRTIIADEAHALKTRDAARTKVPPHPKH